MICAAFSGYSSVVQQLLQAGAQVDHANKTGHTALILAAAYGRLTVVKQLLKNGASVELSDGNGSTAIVVAVQNGHEQIARTLFNAGADARKKNNNGQCALSLLPDDSQLAAELRIRRRTPCPSNSLEQLWVQCASSAPTRDYLLAALNSSYHFCLLVHYGTQFAAARRSTACYRQARSALSGRQSRLHPRTSLLAGYQTGTCSRVQVFGVQSTVPR
ncbi:putative ankyrin repeat protein [Gracilariopsis chorda]|uniref:Putative ankyrin repeat protein n=1 Tax=Gracilariopsis chorda TaxID=448386 RepID=A0A2V3IV08_9FLOR|nr:putative ankyrin repeat protein [Gracilariopsis chorda]|eukprot:PXF44970.1 putative ankyrin repeat protein [Gracilariopsis chorda]